MKFYLLIIISSYLFPFEILDDSMNINYSPLSVESSAMGGVYRPFNTDRKIIFSHLSKFGGIYTLDIIKYNFKQNFIDQVSRSGRMEIPSLEGKPATKSPDPGIFVLNAERKVLLVILDDSQYAHIENVALKHYSPFARKWDPI